MRQLFRCIALALLVGLAACGEGDEGKPAQIACSAGEVACGQSCVDTATDPRHCGGCDVACPAGVLCVDGSCAACPDGWAACEGACVDLNSSGDHCGACGRTSADGELCADGACVPGCPIGQNACDGGCHTLATSDQHCGACGNACAAGSLCADGTCVPTACPADQAVCDGACTDLDTDPAHCGACGEACPAGELCTDGVCEPACGPGMVVCDGACRDPDTDRAHCGVCGNACADGSACVDGACAPSCDPFAATLCDGACTNTELDPANCGACGAWCDDGEVCANGACVEGCPAELATCGATCTDTRRDPNNCGGCGIVCRTPGNGVPVCADGVCAAICVAGYDDCNGDIGIAGGDGCETDILADTGSCGACGNVCPVPASATSFCVGGGCGINCAADRGDCNLDMVDGCETNLRTTANCGGCGVQCPGASICSNDGFCEPAGAGADCDNAIPLAAGANSLAWNSTRATYLITAPACVTTSNAPAGPDIVLRWDATISGQVTLDFTVPVDAMWTAVLVRDACGAIETPLTCATLTIPFIGTPNTSVTFNAVAGSSYFLHLVSASAATALPNPLDVNVTVQSTSCLPGVNGMVGDAQTRSFTGILGQLFEYFVTADAAPSGWVYFGSTQDVYRAPKAGGAAQAISGVLGTGFSWGYEIVAHGNELYVLSPTSGTTGLVQRISTDGGATFSATDYAVFPTPTSEMRGGTVHGGKLYFVTHEGLSNPDTQIWSVPLGAATLPATATLERTFTGYSGCAGIAVDDANFYVMCGAGSLGADVAVAKIDRTTGVLSQFLLIPATGFFQTQKQVLQLHASDRTGDGLADFLYFMDDVPSVGVICDPAGASPIWSRPYFFGTGTGNYGLGYDPAANSLWVFNDDTNQIIRFQ